MKRLLFCIFLIATGMFSGAVVHAANNCTGATYYDADSDTCIACPAGYDYNTDSGKTSVSQCQTHCAAGTYNNGYSRLEYIEGTGTQYIDTNISAPSGFIADANVTFTDLTKANTIVGEENANGDSYRNFIKVQKNGNKVNWLLGKGAFTWSTVTVATNTKYHVVGSTLTTGAYIDVNETAAVLPVTGGNRTSRNILLFTTSWEIAGNGNNISHMKMYDIKIWDANNVLVRDFIPVRRHSDGAIGMYDRVSDTFFGNAGTGTFIAGEDVNNVFGDGTCTNVGPYHWAGESTVNYGSVGTRNACPAGTHSATQTGTSADVCVACASNEFEYYDGETVTCMETKFTVNTTQMNADDTFSFYMSAIGDFYIDWGDGKSELIKKTSAANTLYSHTYTNASGANGWSIKFGGVSATGSPYYSSSSAVAPIKFYGGTPTLVATVDGSLGALFPTRGNTVATQPRFVETFRGCTNLTQISSDLFNGVTGAFEYMFNNTFYGCTGLTTIPVGLFSGISGTANRLFYGTFQNCSSVTGIPNGLFANITGTPAAYMFESTFNGCTNLTGAVPAGMFSGISGAPAQEMFRQTFQNTKITSVGNNFLGQITSGGGAVQMFYNTFNNCKQLTTVPVDMFNFNNVTTGSSMFAGTFSGDTALTTLPVIAGFDGIPAQDMFSGTFQNCSSLTGPIPNNMFSGISGAPALRMFSSTFNGCTNLTGYVPATLFSGISTDTTATNQMTSMFLNTNLYTSCPCGTRPYNTGFESYFNMRGSGATTVYATACEIGTKSNEHWHNGICTTDCALGFTQLHIGDNIAYTIVAEKVSNPAINIGTGNDVCYVPLVTGTATNAINMSDGVNSYHAVVPDETAPVGFTGQPG